MKALQSISILLLTVSTQLFTSCEKHDDIPHVPTLNISDSLSVVTLFNEIGNRWDGNVSTSKDVELKLIDDEYRVISIRLTKFDLPEARIHEDVSNLTELVYLCVRGYAMSGTIPSQVHQLTKMQRIDFEHTTLQGPLDISHFKDLRVIKVLDNHKLVGGGIVEHLGKAERLISVHIVQTPLLGGYFSSDIGKLQELSHLKIQGIGLTGTIPKEMGSLKSLEILHLGSNKLTGVVPDELGDLTLINLVLSNNLLSWEIPTNSGIWNTEQSPGLDRNSFTGVIPDFILDRNSHAWIHNNICEQRGVGFSNCVE